MVQQLQEIEGTDRNRPHGGGGGEKRRQRGLSTNAAPWDLAGKVLDSG